jgi:hypothetical protein
MVFFAAWRLGVKTNPVLHQDRKGREVTLPPDWIPDIQCSSVKISGSKIQ